MSLTVMDLSAIFNTVDHSILTSVLSNKFGFKDMALKWFNSYLQARSFKVTVNVKYSEEKNLHMVYLKFLVQVLICSTYIVVCLTMLYHQIYT